MIASAATWRSRCWRPVSWTTRTFARAWSGNRGWPRAWSTRTSSRSTRRANPRACSSSRCATSTAPTREHCDLADFGLTRTLADRGVPADGRVLGTLDYVAPEQIRGDEVDGRADVY